MSLKAFHLVFITAAVIFSFWFGAWMYRAYQAEGATSDLVYAVASLTVGVALVVYEGFFIKKLKHVSYL
jgi:hypothetical protein